MALLRFSPQRSVLARLYPLTNTGLVVNSSLVVTSRVSGARHTAPVRILQQLTLCDPVPLRLY